MVLEASRNVRAWGLAALLLGLGTPLHALVIAGYEGARHDRFASGYPDNPVENASFFRSGSDFHGVGWNASNGNQAFALITPQHIIGANHYNPGAGTAVEFFSSGGTIRSYTLAATETVMDGSGNPSDVFVGELASPIGPGDNIPFFRFPSDSVGTTLVGRQIVIYGKTARVGINTVAARDATKTASGALGGGANLATTETFEWTFTEGSESQDQARTESGDSGSPTFTVEEGVLTIVGTHSALASVTAGTTTYTAIDADLYEMMDEIDAAIGRMGSTGFTVTQIPEPAASASLLALLAGILAGFRKRRS